MATPTAPAWIYLRPGLEVIWRSPSIYDNRVTDREQTHEGSSTTSSILITEQEAAKSDNVRPLQDASKTLTLKEPLGPRQPNSPIWLCETQADNGRQMQVVLKLFCPELSSKINIQEYAASGSGAEELWRFAPSPELRGYREATAFARLWDLQGRSVPYSYGFYRFNFPASTRIQGSVIGHVMEHIKGQEPQVVTAAMRTNSEENVAQADKLMTAIFDTYREIHSRGVAHQDAACRNMRIFWEEPRLTVPRIVIFDFDRSEFGQDWSVYEEEVAQLTTFLLEIGTWYYARPITDWLDGPGQEVYKTFAFDLLRPSERVIKKQHQKEEEESVIPDCMLEEWM